MHFNVFTVYKSYFFYLQVNLIIPLVFLVICSFLVFLPIYVRPFEVGMGLAITATGVPAYFLFVYWQNKPKIIRETISKL